MTKNTCSACQSNSVHSFWTWQEKNLAFVQCRTCGLIWQDPISENPVEDSNIFLDLASLSDNSKASEAIEWAKQFTGFARQSGKALEIYDSTSQFETALSEQGWDVKTIDISSIHQSTEAGFLQKNGIEPNENFDLILCFDCLEQVFSPLTFLQELHNYLLENGGLYLQTCNPELAPRVDEDVLTANDAHIFPFQTLVYLLYKTGFHNTAAELCPHTRIMGNKIDPYPTADAKELIPSDNWHQTLFAFQRNYYWNQVTQSLRDILASEPDDTEKLNAFRKQVKQHPHILKRVRDVCGACLLFVEEIGHLETHLKDDWPSTMARIFDVFKNDYALYDLLQSGPLLGMDIFPGIQRYHFNEKMIYMATPDYFSQHFSMDEAKQLCDSIYNAGKKVVGKLSSVL